MAQTESEQEAPHRCKHMEKVVERIMAKLGERMQTQLQEMVRQSLQDAQTSLETLVMNAQETGGQQQEEQAKAPMHPDLTAKTEQEAMNP